MARPSKEKLPALLGASAAGDPRAYEEVVRRFQAMAVTYAFGILGDFHLAEDAAQEAFIDAYGKLGSLRSPAAFASWLRRIVFKHCDRQTRRKRAALTPLTDAGDKLCDMQTPTSAAQRAEAGGAALAALRSLPERERLVVTMFYMEERSHGEIASFLATTTSTVKSRLHSARRRLKERLMSMAADEIKRHVPDDSFARRVASAVKVFTAPGPAADQIGSPWHRRLLGTIGELIETGDEGFKVAVELSRAPQAKAREKAALHFGLAANPDGAPHLERLMKDANSAVRRMATKSYARLISPVDGEGRRFGAENDFSQWAASVPDGVEALISSVGDSDVKNRWTAVLALRPYARLNDARVAHALEGALSDESHKVRHAAALSLGRPCPGCGRDFKARRPDDGRGR